MRKLDIHIARINYNIWVYKEYVEAHPDRIDISKKIDILENVLNQLYKIMNGWW